MEVESRMWDQCESHHGLERKRALCRVGGALQKNTLSSKTDLHSVEPANLPMKNMNNESRQVSKKVGWRTDKSPKSGDPSHITHNEVPLIHIVFESQYLHFKRN